MLIRQEPKKENYNLSHGTTRTARGALMVIVTRFACVNILLSTKLRSGESLIPRMDCSVDIIDV